jgi:hypothetical protein
MNNAKSVREATEIGAVVAMHACIRIHLAARRDNLIEGFLDQVQKFVEADLKGRPRLTGDEFTEFRL